MNWPIFIITCVVAVMVVYGLRKIFEDAAFDDKKLAGHYYKRLKRGEKIYIDDNPIMYPHERILIQMPGVKLVKDDDGYEHFIFEYTKEHAMIAEKVLRILKEYTGSRPALDDLFDDMPLDSLDEIEIVMAVESEFNIVMDDDGPIHMGDTILDFINKIHDEINRLGDSNESDSGNNNGYGGTYIN